MTARGATHLFPSPDNMAACVDLYELTMAAGYFVQGTKDRIATFQYSIRTLPRNRSYLVTAGLEQALKYLGEVRFSCETIHFLRKHRSFSHVPREFFEYLADFRFTGDVVAMPEGTVAFPDEPVLFVRGPLIEAQIVETYLLTTLNFQTLIATKAARVVEAARGRPVADFGARRAHGPQAGLLAARAAFIGGCTSTSNVLAAQELGIPCTGTQAHSWIMAFGDERVAFRRYADVFPDSTTLLIDTYDTIRGAKNAAAIGRTIKAVRLDSGNLLRLSRRVRTILDEAGMRDVKIVASGDLNERRIDRLIKLGAPIDLFGVGTELVTSRDDPAVGGVYKLVEIADGVNAAIKLSRRKESLPYLKQVFRTTDRAGRFRRDTVCLSGERHSGGPLLKQFMKSGRVIQKLPDIRKIQEFCKGQIERLPSRLRGLDAAPGYPVVQSKALQSAAARAFEEWRSSGG